MERTSQFNVLLNSWKTKWTGLGWTVIQSCRMLTSACARGPCSVTFNSFSSFRRVEVTIHISKKEQLSRNSGENMQQNFLALDPDSVSTPV